MNWLRSLFGGGASKREPAPKQRQPSPPKTLAELAARAQPYAEIRFVEDVLKVYRRTGKLSSKQTEALMRIVLEREAEERDGN